MKRSAILILLNLLAVGQALGQDAGRDTSAVVQISPVVVTATRTPKELADVAVPMKVVSAQEIEARGALRLSDVLEEVTGLALFEDHGTGIQIQGFSPEYTLILIDGEPVIGRTSGTLDLDRLTVGAIERVEIVRGPSSSLYGSEALAGVINLITRPPADGVSTSLRTRYGTHEEADVAAVLEAGRERGGARLLLNRFSSAGYDLSPDVFGPTTPRYTDYTADARLHFDPSDRTKLILSSRLAVQNQQSAFALIEDAVDVPHDQTDRQVDWSLHPEVSHRFSSRLGTRLSLYAARFTTDNEMTRQSDGSLYSADHFDQRYGKAELQGNYIWNPRHLTAAGVGGVYEALGGDRYSGARPQAESGFLFVQHEWLTGRGVDVNASARLDRHSDYAPRVSPKLSLLFKPWDAWRLRLSAGSGFKAPDFRQLYLSFTNAAAGYSVLGSTQLQEGLERLQAEGQIEQVLIDPTTLETISAEHSIAYNVGVSGTPVPWLDLSLNAFRNNVADMIETQPVARKVNGSFVYGYFNLNRIYTQGVETEATLWPAGRLSFTAGYQFLQARDPEVVDAIQEGMVFTRDAQGRDRRVTLSDYGGLFGRSKHSGVLAATYSDVRLGLRVTLRGILRGRYGYRDADGNGIANRPDEFVPGYVRWNTTVTKDWPLPGRMDRVSLQVGADNLLDYARPGFFPSMPGRKLYAGLNLYL